MSRALFSSISYACPFSNGEAILRLSVPTGQRIEIASALNVHSAGAESNVQSLLARLGRRCGWISGLPANPPGRLIVNQLRMADVDLSEVSWQADGRVGTYYVVINPEELRSLLTLPPQSVTREHLQVADGRLVLYHD